MYIYIFVCVCVYDCILHTHSYIHTGHGAMLDLPEHAHLGKLLRAAHATALPTWYVCVCMYT
jgi:hypothetical protein